MVPRQTVTCCALTLLWALSLGAPCLGLTFDPCAAVQPVKKSDRFVIGLALIPGVNLTLLSNFTSNFTGGLCSTDFQNYLVNTYNAKVAVYELRVDRLLVLKMPYPDIIFNMVNATPPTMALVAFRANYTSQPIIIVSGDDTITTGGGFAVSAALLLRFSKGSLTYLQWYDQTCNECGGKGSSLCLNSTAAGVFACATSLTNCTCVTDGVVNSTCRYTDSRFEVCATSINAAWLGEDSTERAFSTGPQVQRLNAYSIVSLYQSTKTKLVNVYNQNIKSSWGAITSDVSSQYVDFEGGLTQYDRTTGGGSFRPPPPPAPLSPPSPPTPPSPPGNGTNSSSPSPPPPSPTP